MNTHTHTHTHTSASVSLPSIGRRAGPRLKPGTLFPKPSLSNKGELARLTPTSLGLSGCWVP